MEMEYGRAFAFPTQNIDWVKKWAIAGAISLIPIVGQLVMAGYSVEITRRVINNEPTTLPDWSDFGAFLRKGFGVLVIGLVYFLPIVLLGLCLGVPLGVASALQSGASDTEWLGQLGGFLGACLGCLGALYGLVAGMLLQVALGRYAATDQIGAALRVAEVFALVRAKPGVFLIVMVVSALAQSVLTSLAVIACVIGAAWGGAYAALATAHLTGQAYRYVSATSAPQ